MLNIVIWSVAAFAFGFAFRTLVRAITDWGRSGLAFSAALLATLGALGGLRGWRVFGMIGPENLGILLVVSFMFLLPAGLGVHLASLGKSKP